MENYAGKYLRVVGNTSYLPQGIVVYCIHDNQENLFVIRTFQVYNHVQEFHFEQSDKKKFKIYN
jgi:hypothetical protein